MQWKSAYPLQLGSSSWADMFMKGTWAAWYNIRLLIKLTPKGVVVSFLFFEGLPGSLSVIPDLISKMLLFSD